MNYSKKVWSHETPTIKNNFENDSLKKLYKRLSKLPLVDGMNEDKDLAFLSFNELTKSYQHMFLKFASRSYSDIEGIISILDGLWNKIPSYQHVETIDGVSCETLYVIPTQGLLPIIIREIKRRIIGHNSISITIASISPTVDDRLFDYRLVLTAQDELICNKTIDFSNFEDNIVKYNFLVYLYLFGCKDKTVYIENSPKVVFDYDYNKRLHSGESYKPKQLPIIR